MAGVIGGHRQSLLDPPGDQRNVEHIGIHRRGGEQSYEPVLDDGTGFIPRVASLLPAGVLLAHRDDVGIGAVAQKTRHRGLRQHQQFTRLAEFGQHLGAQPCHPQPAGLIGDGAAVGNRAALSPENHEVAVAQPAQ